MLFYFFLQPQAAEYSDKCGVITAITKANGVTTAPCFSLSWGPLSHFWIWTTMGLFTEKTQSINKWKHVDGLPEADLMYL